MRGDSGAPTEPTAPTPAPDLKALGDKLVGRWKISGESVGETTYEWMEGGFFLIQRGHVARPEATYDFIQIIGYDRTPGNEPGDEITGRLYTSGGDTLTYICEAGERTLTIWFGEKGSPSFYKGEFSEDGGTIAGAWHWPSGGYEETMTRQKPQAT